MNAATRLSPVPFLFCLACSSGSGAPADGAGGSTGGAGAAGSAGATGDPALYQSAQTFEAEELGAIELQPEHRRGPNPLPDDELSVLPLTVWAPSGAGGPLSTVIWSHGGGSRMNPGESGPNWAAAFARAGYAVVAMHHMARSGRDVIRNVCAPNGIAEADCDPQTYIPFYESTDRPRDAIAVLDELESIGMRFGLELDPTRSAIGGHSGGTNTPLYLAGGERNALPPAAPGELLFQLPDPRPSAFIAMSPPGAAISGWQEGTLAAIDRPVLTATGAADLDPDNRIQVHEALGAGSKYRAYLNSDQANHSTFNLEGATTELTPDFRELLIAAATALLDGYVEDVPAAREWLEGGAPGRRIDSLISPDPNVPSWDAK